jgi:uncharacterized Zn-binding protein involved in type VI secretion
MPAAARVGDDHRCKHVTNGVPHKGGEILHPGARTVFIGEEPAARAGDRCWCEGGAYDVIVTGEPTVLICGKPAARLGDATDGGYVKTGDTTVQIGPHPQGVAFREAARKVAGFVEKYVRVKVGR